MTAQPLVLTRCPAWCQDHHYDEDAEWTVHEALVGLAGPLEVALECFVLPDQPDSVSELVIYATGQRPTGARLFAVPLDVPTIEGLARVLRRALDVTIGPT